ncbi:hypothetical protein GOC57_30935 [Sinorhizobium meliloti]|uniref:hypothetical protein n=1 Tax=Rhizobium meliloti TaxID=382 RepID=UPI0012961C60|nr:hypothetical protein [Sinorhizobium meliloti]MDW9378032.1 hypothetical protein [Sinorhizobium meliloti]MDW9496633.1 hypothetical protein [Sinorhizobium meliloti]MDW9565185.1 hypothetical protein [Sinorhizobium meliloti]MDW9652611.1 hypothetical protein [Sinorhizobium meliloti]MDW9862807.1 hypothetical protein [Sinorhizobium meliloti]
MIEERAEREIYLAPRRSAADWRRLSGTLVRTPWAKAFDESLFQRLESRYLKPIRVLQDKGSWEGEGFSIISIQCAMLEFLAACRGGLIYRHKNPVPPHEYNMSGDLFASFLSTTAPFNELFTRDDAVEFYRNVRCALLHEARTKNGWIIQASGRIGVDCSRKIVNRNTLQMHITDYIDGYGRDLLTDTDLQAAFVRKFDDLAS